MLNQVVFLIDTNIEHCFTDNSLSLSNSICLSCLRVLHFLSSNVDKRSQSKTTKFQHTPVKWSYKFFSSNYHVTKIESHKLYDFKLKYFEEFENEVQRRFENSVSNSSKVGNNHYKPSDTLNLALMQLLADFQWENPDITSPVKGHKRKESPSSCRNLVVLFTKCPKNTSQLKKFSGKQVPDADVFLDSILPGSLFEQFCTVSRLSLHWIDTQHTKFYCDSNVKSIQIIEEAIRKARGNVLPLDAVVQHGSPCYSDVSKLLDDAAEEEEVAKITNSDVSDVTCLLPSTTVLSAWFRQNDMHNSTSMQKGKVILEIGGKEVVIAVKEACKLSEQRGKTRDSTVDLESISNLPAAASDTSWLYSSHLKAYGLLQKDGIEHVSIQHSCVCHSELSTDKHHKTHTDCNNLFYTLLGELAVRKFSLVLNCFTTGHLVILQPLTTSTATLSLISQGGSLSIEKLLVAQELEIASLGQDAYKGESCDSLVERLVSRMPIPQPLVRSECVGRGRSFDGRLMDRWLIPGPSQTLHKLINKLNQRIADLDFLTPDEAGALKQLQKCYKLENKPPGLRDTPTAFETFTKPSEDQDRFELPYKGKSSRVSLSRTEMILCKSKAVAKERDQVKEEVTGTGCKTRKDRPDIAPHLADFSSIEELQTYLTSTYERLTTGETTNIDTTVQMMVSVALHYLKQTKTDKAEEHCKELLDGCVLLTGAQLRDKYNQTEDLSLEHKIAEYEVQVVLRLEIISTLENRDQDEGVEEVNDEVVGLLRTLSFVWEPGLLNKFMESSLLHNYMHTIPRTLANIYDELMQPLPDILANLVSPNTSSSGDQSVLGASIVSHDEVGGPPSARTRSHGSVGPPSSQPGSNKSLILENSMMRGRGGRKLVHHPSLADFGAKRQIVVEKIAKPKPPSRSAKKNKDSQKKSRDKVTKALFDKSRGGVKLERRQSVAVMQRTSKTPRKSPKKALKSPRRLVSPRKRLVAETPTHKQMSHVLKKGEGHRRHHSVAMEMTADVIEESPVKACNQSLKDSPTKGKRAKALLRRSFYSAGPTKRTKNLTQYFQLADRIAGRQRNPSGHDKQDSTKPAKLLSFDASSHFKSPDKNSSFLLSQLVSSPSPAKATPRKLLTQTPSKLVAESPSYNTRSRHIASPVVDLFKSPTSRARVASPACRLLQSPVSRRQSPQVLVAESDTKTGPGSPHATPEKAAEDSVCGMISSGLDSPSQNTRHRTSQTPTRKSVRAALFARSPATNRVQSPYRGTASPRTLLSKFGSPCKQPKDEEYKNIVGSPSRQGIKSLRDESPLKKVLSPLKYLGPVPCERDTNKLLNTYSRKTAQVTINDVFNDVVKQSQRKPIVHQSDTSIQKTPSPKCKKSTKTPDSFDKWHRRKPRSCQSSPAVNKTKLQPSSLTVLVPSSDSNCRTQENRFSESGKSDFDMKPVLGTFRNKRSMLLSPEKSNIESPKKRLRTQLDSVSVKPIRHSSAVRSIGGSQGFDASGSFNELSQISNISSEYFSVTNDDVFLSQTNDSGLNGSMPMDTEDVENMSQGGLCKTRSLFSSTQGVSSPRNKMFDRLLSSDLPDVSDNERSESPIFGASRRTRNKSGGGKLMSLNSDGFTIDSAIEQVSSSTNCSPKLPARSPATKKYSPNVSAKSLMHLIQSPLLRSPEGGDQTADGTSPRHGKATAGRSRRSLKMHN